jgi:small-conductance mechanosensitive channel
VKPIEQRPCCKVAHCPDENSGAQAKHSQEVAMRTLRVMAEDMAEAHLPAVLQRVLPAVLAGAQGDRMTPAALRLSLVVVATCVKSVAMMESAARKQLREVLRRELGALVAAMCGLVARELPSDDPLCASRCTLVLYVLCMICAGVVDCTMRVTL